MTTSSHRATPNGPDICDHSRHTSLTNCAATMSICAMYEGWRPVRAEIGCASLACLLRRKFKDRAIDVCTDCGLMTFGSSLPAQSGRASDGLQCIAAAAALRSYLRYRATCGDQVGELDRRHPEPRSLEAGIAATRAQRRTRLTVCWNRFTARRRWPKRGYAIVRCALDMGLRSGEIARLMISDIDWRAGTVTLRGTKSLRQDILPLPMETGQALADYLQHERPVSHQPGDLRSMHRGEHDQPITSVRDPEGDQASLPAHRPDDIPAHMPCATPWPAVWLRTAARSRKSPTCCGTAR